MVKVTVKLDTRHRLADGTFPLKIKIHRKSRALYIPTGRTLSESEWDKTRMKAIPLKANVALNNSLEALRMETERKILELQDSGRLREYTDKQLIEYISDDSTDASQALFSTQAESFLSLKTNKRTREIYKVTLGHIKDFCNYETLRCDDITTAWLHSFDSYLIKPCPAVNTRAIHLRNVRAIINHAIDNEVLSTYAFRRFQIKTEDTEKRSLTLEQMKTLLHAQTTDTQRKYLDCFFLVFYLIGINMVDLSRLVKVENGRVKYRRAKTGTLYSIKVEPEALTIIKRYAGARHLLRFFDTNTDYRNFVKKLNTNISKVAKANGINHNISVYWARHTWATLAAELEIPRDTISEALGHKYGSKVTAVYVDFDKKKVDEANRRVIDYLYS